MWFIFKFNYFTGQSCSTSCEEIKVNSCREILHYNRTGFPNVLNHTNLAEADELGGNITAFAQVTKTCYPNVELFACSLLYPVCDENLGLKFSSNTSEKACEEFAENCKTLLSNAGQYLPPAFVEILNDCNKLVVSPNNIKCMSSDSVGGNMAAGVGYYNSYNLFYSILLELIEVATCRLNRS